MKNQAVQAWETGEREEVLRFTFYVLRKVKTKNKHYFVFPALLAGFVRVRLSVIFLMRAQK